MKTTADLLGEYKAATGITDQQIADAVGVAQSSVSDWVNGKAIPVDRHLPALARVLGLDVDELAVLASYSRRIRAKNVDQVIGLISQLEAAVLRLEKRLDALERPAARRAPKAR